MGQTLTIAIEVPAPDQSKCTPPQTTQKTPNADSLRKPLQGLAFGGVVGSNPDYSNSSAALPFRELPAVPTTEPLPDYARCPHGVNC